MITDDLSALADVVGQLREVVEALERVAAALERARPVTVPPPVPSPHAPQLEPPGRWTYPANPVLCG